MHSNQLCNGDKRNWISNGQKTIEQLHEAMDKAVNFVAPLISVALVGVESRNEHLNNQVSLIDDLLNIQSMEGWNRAGLDIWFEIPYALGYVYHSLHGSFCLQTNQLDLAFSLAQAKISFSNGFTVYSEFVGKQSTYGAL